MANQTSQTIYLDSAEEITGVIDRVQSADSGLVNLVVPKNAVLFQSVVNLKLLKKAAARAKKNVTIVTRDETGQHLAHSAGLLVRERVGAPVVEQGPTDVGETKPPEVTIKEQNELTEKPVVKPATKQETTVPSPSEKSIPARITKPAQASRQIPAKHTKSQAKKIALLPSLPWKWIGGGVVGVLALGFILLTFVFARGVVKVTPVTETATLDLEVVALESPDPQKNEIVGQYIELSKEHDQQVTPGGTKEIGERATGSITISNVFSDEVQAFGVNTRIQSKEGPVFLLSGQVSVPGASVKQGKAVPGTVTTNVVAEKVGEEYNIGASSFTFIDLPSDKQAAITGASSGSMSGGTKREVKVLTSEDVEKAAEKAREDLGQSMVDEVRSKIEAGAELLDEAFEIRTTDIVPAVAVGTEVEEGTVSIKTTVVLKGISSNPDDISKLGSRELSETLSDNRELLESSSEQITWTVASVDFSQKRLVVSVHAERLASFTIDEEALKEQIKALSKQDAELLLFGWPEIESVDVSVSPFWRNKIPSSINKIKVDNIVQ